MQSQLPQPFQTLRSNEALRRELELDWLDDGAAAFVRDEWLEIWNQIPFNEPFHSEGRERLSRCVPLAQGLLRERRLSHIASRLALVWDPLEPEYVFISLSHAIPAQLWLRASTEPQAILEILAPYLVEAGPIAALPRHVRVVKALDLPSRSVLESALDNLELWLDDATWASAFGDDPWLRVDGPLNMVQQSIWRRDTVAEHGGRFPSMSWRTLWSKSVLRIEQHPFGMWVFDMRYAPASDGRAVAYVNEVAPGHLPLDMPVDLAASLLREGNLDEIYVADLRARGERVTEQLAITCGLAPAEPTTHELLRKTALEYADDPDVLAVIADLATSYGHDAVLFELAVMTEGTPLGADLLAHTKPMGPVQ